MLVYLGLLISTSHYSYLLGSWVCWDDKTDNFKATYPCSENKAACLYHPQEIQTWRLTHEHGQNHFCGVQRTHVVTFWLEMALAMALKRVRIRRHTECPGRGLWDATHSLERLWLFSTTLATRCWANCGAYHHFFLNTRPAAGQKGRAMRYKQEEIKKLVCKQSGEQHHKTEITTL